MDFLRKNTYIGCEDNPESLYELTEIDGILSWKKMFQELEYPRDSTIAMLIPDTLVDCQ